MPGFGFYI